MDAEPELFGYVETAAAQQRALERDALALASADSAAECSRTLAARPHVAGSAGDIRARDYVLERMCAWGLDVTTAEYEVYLPYPTEVLLERLSPEPRRLTLREPALPEARAAGDPEQWPAWHAYAAAGDVHGPLVYVNYAREADLDLLTEQGISLAGRIALARYGGEIFRGNKVLNVQRRGAVGCVLYSDPYDDGYFRGDVYPQGPMRPAGGIQRGSLNTGAGDPTAPGRVCELGTADADRRAGNPRLERIRPDEALCLPQIPSLPIGYGIAQELLAGLGGPSVPQEWQGALPLRYHVGPGPVEVRIRIRHDGGFRRVWNTIGRLGGSEFPDEWVIVGAHRDAWCCGAVDNVSGVTSVLEAARICAALARAGRGPRRALLFATWDAEEWGLVGSTEWAAQHREELMAKAVAYINQDVVVSGPDFGAAASPALAGLVREIAGLVPSPDQPAKSVYDVWVGRRDQPPVVAQPGGGSDHEAFYLHLGIPACGHGFSGPWGNYHSAYDVTDWMERTGDPGYARHRAAASFTALLALRTANADIPPLDYALCAELIAVALERMKERAGTLRRRISFEPLARRAAAVQIGGRARCEPAAHRANGRAHRGTTCACGARANERRAHADSAAWQPARGVSPTPCRGCRPAVGLHRPGASGNHPGAGGRRRERGFDRNPSARRAITGGDAAVAQRGRSAGIADVLLSASPHPASCSAPRSHRN